MNSRLQTPAPPANAVLPLFRPGETCTDVVPASRVGLIVDGEEYFRAFAEAAEAARESILILAWDFDSRASLGFGPDGASRGTIGEFLNRQVRKHPGLHVHVLIWDYPMLYAIGRELPPIYGLGWRPERRVHLHYDSSIPVGACHHQKVVVIDDQVAFAGGLDLTSRRWDTSEHRADDPRRTVAGTGYAPFHDTMMAVSGEAARALGALARDRWRCATGRELAPPTGHPRRRLGWGRRSAPPNDPWPASVAVALENVEVALSRTVPAGETGRSVREIETLYLEMIAAARETIYIENQYFTAHRLGEALEARLREPDGPEVVVVVRLLSHGWLEGLSMEALRTGLIRRLREADTQGRFRVYYPQVCGLPKEQCLDVHSKLMIVDDQILRIGSANFANRSMGFDTECDLTIAASGEERVATVIADFRDRLLAEHLDVSREDVRAAVDRGNGLIAAIESLVTDDPERRTLRPLEVSEDQSNAMGGIAKLADPEEVVPLDGLIDQFQPAEGAVQAGRPPWRLMVGLALGLAGLAALWRWTPIATAASSDGVVRLVEAWGTRPWIVPALLLSYPVASFVLFPRPLLTLFAVLAFGPWGGLAIALAGMQLATLANYLVGRRLDRQRVRRLAGRNLNRISRALRHRGVIAMTVLRLVPLAPFAVIGLVAGAARTPVVDLLLGTLLGTLPGTLVTTVLGGRLEAILRHPRPIDYGIFAAFLGLAIAAAVVVRRKLLRVQLPTKPA